jgi:hypothetical protein
MSKELIGQKVFFLGVIGENGGDLVFAVELDKKRLLSALGLCLRTVQRLDALG